jgi:hypothetical protein
VLNLRSILERKKELKRGSKKLELNGGNIILRIFLKTYTKRLKIIIKAR